MSQKWIVLQSFVGTGFEQWAEMAIGPFDHEATAEAKVRSLVEEYHTQTGKRSGQEPNTTVWEVLSLSPEVSP